MKTYSIAFFILSFLLLSCSTPKNIAYFVNIEGKDSSITMLSNYEIKIVPDDELSIAVSALDPVTVAMFNLPTVAHLIPGETQLMTTPSIQTFLVDAKGNINFPILGKLHIAGLTRSELVALLQEKIAKYVKDPIVTVQVINFKVVVMGEVTIPSTVKVTGERISILDALSRAGDLTIYGQRNNVLVIREENGRKEVYRMDLTDKSLFTSPYYYLKQNDVVYVEPNSARKGFSKYNQNKQFNISVISTIISAISVIASLGIALSK